MPENELTQYGEFAEQVIEILPDRFNVSIPKYVIIPTHLHLIIEINHDDEKRAIRESPLQYHRSIIDKLVGFLKMNESKKIHNTTRIKYGKDRFMTTLFVTKKIIKKYGNT